MAPRKKAGLRAVKTWNLHLVLETIRQEPGVSRYDVAKATGLDPATVGKLAGELLDRGFVRELDKVASSGGRRPVPLSIADSPYRFLTIKLLRNCLEFDLLDFSFRPIGSRRIPCPKPLNPAALTRRLRENLDIASGGAVLGAAVGVAGVADARNGIVLRCPCLRGTDFPAGQVLGDALGVPTIVENLTRAQAWREAHTQEGAGSLLLLHAGKGIGAALVHDGRLLRGAAGASGEIGHTIVDPNGPPCPMGHAGCLESMTNTDAFERDMSTVLRRSVSYADVDALCERSRRCRNVVVEKARLLAEPLAFLVDAFDPEEVVLTGPLFESSDVLFQQVSHMARQRAFTGNGALTTHIRRSLSATTQDQQSLARLLWDETASSVLKEKG